MMAVFVWSTSFTPIAGVFLTTIVIISYVNNNNLKKKTVSELASSYFNLIGQDKVLKNKLITPEILMVIHPFTRIPAKSTFNAFKNFKTTNMDSENLLHAFNAMVSMDFLKKLKSNLSN